MKRKYSLIVTILSFTITGLLLMSTANAFWFGDKESLYENLGGDVKKDFAECLDSENIFDDVDAVNATEKCMEDWYGCLGTMLPQLSPEQKEGLNHCLTSYILPELDTKLSLNDNRDDDEGVTIYKTKEAYGGYTLLSSIRGHGCNEESPAVSPFPGAPPVGLSFPVVNKNGKVLNTNTCGAILIDMDGNIVKEWPLMAVPAKMLPDGDVLGLAIDFANGPPIGGIQTVMQMDWCGNEIWRWPSNGFPSFPILGGARAHHDFQREGNPVGYFAPGQEPITHPTSKNLVLSNIVSPNPPSVPDDLIFPGISSFELLEDAIYEVGTNGAITWEWYPNEHFDQMGFNQAAKDAIMNSSVFGIGGVGGSDTTDWQHINTTSYLGPNKWFNETDEETWIFHPDNVIYDSRTANYLAIIAKVDHPEGKWVVGDIVWRVGPNYTEGNEESQIGQIIGPHMAHMIPQGLPGDGNILVFDNGGVAGYGSLLPGLPGTYPATFRDFSRVIEFNPLTLEVVWEYKNPETGKKGRKFYSRLISGAQRLENGNTQITEGASGRVFEVNNKGEIVWEYIHNTDYANGAFGLLGFLPSTAIYRAYRIPETWLPASLTCP